MKKILLALAMFICSVAVVSAQWLQDAGGNISTFHNVSVSGTFTYSNSIPMLCSGLSVPNGIISTSSLGVGTNGPTTRLTVQDGSFLLHMDKNSTFKQNADFDLAEIGTRFSFNAYRSIFRGGEITYSEYNSDRGTYSFGFGLNPKASGSYSLAIGNSSQATNTGAVALGTSTASGQYSSALGFSTASGDYSFAAGKSAAVAGFSSALGESHAGGDHSFTSGSSWTGDNGSYSAALNGSNANGVYSFAVNKGQTDGAYSFASGSSYTLGQYSTALGGSQATADYSFSSGYLSAANGINSTAIGTSVSATGTNSMILGSGADKGNPLINKIDNSLMIGFGSATLPSVFVGSTAFNIDKRFGFVGIGTTTPKYELSVNGSILARGAIFIENLPGEWPDYVFNKNYSLTPLSDVEKFIDANHHLPGVPSQEEIKKEGLNLGEMEMIMMKKIEELTLHMIQMEKENVSLKDQVKELQNKK